MDRLEKPHIGNREGKFEIVFEMKWKKHRMKHRKECKWNKILDKMEKKLKKPR